MGPPVAGRIPWSVLHKWCEFHNITIDDFRYLDRLIWEMDSVYIQDFKRNIQNQNSKLGSGDKPQTSDEKIARWEAS